MKQGKLYKEGKYWKLQQDGKQPMSLPGFDLPEELNGQTVEFDNSGGPVKKIRFDSKDYLPPNRELITDPIQRPNNQGGGRPGPQQQRNQNYGNNPAISRKPAKAPYNFIPLNSSIISTTSAPDSDRYYSASRFTGYIDLKIQNKTSFFIRGRDLHSDNQSENFFQWQNRHPVIPGSSLRGLIRSIVEITSWSEMEFTDKEHVLYHRGMADLSLKTTYNNERRGLSYRDPVLLEREKQQEKVGFLKFENYKYRIYPARCLGICRRDFLKGKPYIFKNENGTEYWEIHPGNAPGSRNPERNNKAWKIGISSRAPNPLRDIPNKVIDSYKADENRGEGIPDVLKCARDRSIFTKCIRNPAPSDNIIAIGVPVFYNTNNNGEITSFGYNRNYRIPYTHNIGSHILQNWTKPSHQIDFARAVFGRISNNEDENNHATRVFFEDSNPGKNIDYEERSTTQPLMAPKPTTFQHYITQPRGYQTARENLKHWGDNGAESPIRGYKNYWHRQTNDSKDTTTGWVKERPVPAGFQPGEMRQYPINAIKAGAEFTQRIRFENLSEQELGCLLFAIDLPPQMCHKLGLAKSLGLGSIRIDIGNLSFNNPTVRYKELFADDGSWNTGECLETDIDKYKNVFAAYIGAALNKPAINSFQTLWDDNERMVHLKAMLTFNHNIVENNRIDDWLERTRYQLIDHPVNRNEYKDRPVLPNPIEVITENTYRNS